MGVVIVVSAAFVLFKDASIAAEEETAEELRVAEIESEDGSNVGGGGSGSVEKLLPSMDGLVVVVVLRGRRLL